MSFFWWVPSLVVAALVAGVPLLSYLGILGPEAFGLFGLGVVLAAVFTISLAAAGAFASATGRAWRRRAVAAAAIPLVCLLAVLGPLLLGGGANHPIHDVTTDLADTLAFTPDVAALEQSVMDRAQVLEIQEQSYPDLAPLMLTRRPAGVFAEALATAREMDRWEIVHSDEQAGRIEAQATSRIFRFVDDVVIRVQAEGQGARVDMRSRSRMGQSDLGANAERIRSYLAALHARF